jgi:DNA-binding NtrC family response regulator
MVRILIIDDERVVADTLAKIFTNAGYEARVAYSAEAALELLDREGWIPALAIVDVLLPGMNGVNLAIQLRARYPDMRLSLYSGHAMTANLLEDARKKGHAFDVLPKPVHPTVFLDLASSLCHESSAG